MELRKARNIVIGAGAYYISQWLAVPLTALFGRFIYGGIYRGDFDGYIVMPLVGHSPQAVAAVAGGAIVIWFVESDRPVGWALIPSFLYALMSFYGHHWLQPPMLLDRMSETVGALFPALACFVGAVMAARWVTTQNGAQVTPG